MSAACVFCKIVSGEIPSNKVFEDDHAVAFTDISPVAPVHVLVIPRGHVTFLADLADLAEISQSEQDERLLGHLLAVASRVAMEHGLDENGYRLTVNQGQDAGQIVDHLHVHVLGGRQLAKIG